MAARGTDYVYSGATGANFTSGTGKEYFEELFSSQTNGKSDEIDNFQAASGGKGTFIFMPAQDAGHTAFIQTNAGTYIQALATDGSGGISQIFVKGAQAMAVRAQTSFNL